MRKNKIKIICFAIGSEILRGLTFDTNSIFLENKINSLGLSISKKIILSDNYEIIAESVKNEISSNDIFFSIGGLGPTFDDITIDSLSKIFDLPVSFDTDAINKVENFFSKSDILDEDILKKNLRQARFIGSALKNISGFSVGSFFKINFENREKFFFLLPGPPEEFKNMLQHQVLPILQSIVSKFYDENYKIFHKNLFVYNISESKLENLFIKKGLSTFSGIYAKKYQKIIDLSSSDYDEIIKDLHLIANIDNIAGYYLKDINKQFVFNETFLEVGTDIKTNEHIIITEDLYMQNILFDIFCDTRYTISFAESLTGGLLSGLLTEISGSSKIFKGSIVCYSNESKINVLNIDKNLLDSNGAVSNEIAKAMASNCKKIFNSDIGVGLTGIAGPTGATDEKPLGLCYISSCSNDFEKVYRFNFSGDRITNQNLAAVFGYFLAIYTLTKSHKNYTF